MDILAKLKSQYECAPYPTIPLFAKINPVGTYPLNLECLESRCFGFSRDSLKSPARILVAGAGTFEPCAVALANPRAEIKAIDLSRRSLRRLRWHSRWHGCAQQVKIEVCDLLRLNPEQHGVFDLVIATGVLHHLPSLAEGLGALRSVLAPNGVLRTMIYSQAGRQGIYRLQKIFRNLGITNRREAELFLRALPSDHPLRIEFLLYSDAQFRSGFIDGFLPSHDQGYDLLELEQIFTAQGLKIRGFQHPPGGRPSDLDALSPAAGLSDVERVTVLDRLRQLDSNFVLLATAAEYSPDRVAVSRAKMALNSVIETWSRGFAAKLNQQSFYSRSLRQKLVVTELKSRLEQFNQRLGSATPASVLKNWESESWTLLGATPRDLFNDGVVVIGPEVR